MENDRQSFWSAYKERSDLKRFGEDALLLFALQLKYGIEDIITVATNSLTEGGDDKKADLVHIDTEEKYAVIAQAYINEKMEKKSAPANKASDLNTAVSWLINRPIEDVPERLKTHAKELRDAIKNKEIDTLNIWYVHNLPESDSVKNELKTVEHTANSAILSTLLEDTSDIEIQALEVGVNTINEWYQSISTPILINEEYELSIDGGFKINGKDWESYFTAIQAKWLYEQFKKHKTKLFSANVRDYLGRRKTDKNINNEIKRTAEEDPGHFLVYNNGITALVHSFEERIYNGRKNIYFKGISIINGAQTTGAIGNLLKEPNESAKVQIRFIKCNDATTLTNIVKYNNSQNKITAPDFRSNDKIQGRLKVEFDKIKDIQYLPRRGGHEDVIKRRANVLSSVTAGQALAAFHKDPAIAYHKKTNIWEDDQLYSRYFSAQTTANHIVFVYSLLKKVENKKLNLMQKSKIDELTKIEEKQLEFFRKRGSTFLLVAAISSCLEIILGQKIPNTFDLKFKKNISPSIAEEKWEPIVDISSSFTAPLSEGLADGFKKVEAVKKAIETFQSLLDSTKYSNKEIFSDFKKIVL